jgi:hypothetical protein
VAGDERRGRSLVLFAIVSTVLLSGLSVAFQLLAFGPLRTSRAAVRCALTVALGIAMFRGYRWARGLMILLCFAASIIAGWLIWTQAAAGVAWWLAIAQGTFYGGVGLLLWLSPSVRAFIDYQSFVLQRRRPRR